MEKREIKCEKSVKGEKNIKPKLLAVSKPKGGYAAGCPSRDSYQCNTCFRQ
jgi:hypothetical protein